MLQIKKARHTKIGFNTKSDPQLNKVNLFNNEHEL